MSSVADGESSMVAMATSQSLLALFVSEVSSATATSGEGRV